MAVTYKITDLAAATTPLAGTELVEIVQSGVNKKVAVDDLIAAAGDFVADTDPRLTDGRAPTGAAGGDLSGTYPNPTVAKVAGVTPGATGLALLDDATAAAARTTLGTDAAGDARPPTGAAGGDLSGTYPNPTVANDAITNAKLAQVTGPKFKGRLSGTGNPQDLTGAQATSMLDVFGASAKGLVPAASASPSATKVLSEAGTWITPAGGTFDLLSTLTNAEVDVNGATVASANRMHKIRDNGGVTNYTITLPTAVGIAGALIGFRVGDWSQATKIYTIDGNSTEKIDNRLTLDLVHTNTLILVSDGTGWRSVVRSLDSPWVDAGTITFDATTTPPVKGTTSRDKVWWRRVGGDMQIRYEYVQTGAGTDCVGELLFTVPMSASVDTAQVLLTTAANQSGFSPILGSYSSSAPAANVVSVGFMNAYSASRLRAFLISTNGATTNGGVVAAGNTVFGVADGRFAGFASVPITGW